MIKEVIKYLAYLYPYKLIKKVCSLNRQLQCECIKRKLNASGDVSLTNPYSIKGEKCISLGKNFWAGPGLNLEAYEQYQGEKYSPIIKIGDNFSIGFGGHIAAINSIIIGNDVLCGSKVFIGDHSHGVITKEELGKKPLERSLYSKAGIKIKDNVWIGDGVCILAGVTIGTGVIIGSNAVVTKDIPDYSVAAGIPAKVIKNF